MTLLERVLEPLARVTTDAGMWGVELDSTRLLYGAGRLGELGREVSRLGCERVLVVTDAGIVAAGHVERALATLSAASVDSVLFEGVTENPDSDLVTLVAGLAAGVDGIVGLGGGSPMDTARAVNFVLTGGGTIEDYWGSGTATAEMLPSIGIPTTAGTGSDAQSYALISQAGSGRKMACGDRRAKFDSVILDPELLATTPRAVTAVAGVDALSHAVESYACNRANPVSRLFAREAWKQLATHLAGVLHDDPAVRRSHQGPMLVGAHLAGAAIEQSMLGAAHACANPLTAQHGITHGVAVGLMLPHVVTFNGEAVAAEYAELAAVTGDRPLGEQLDGLLDTAGLPRRLRDCVEGEMDFESLAVEAAAQWTAAFNPRPTTPRELEVLYEAAY